MMSSRPNPSHAVVTRTASRLALRQQNLAVLVPVLFHDVNGSLNGLALSTELLSRLQRREVPDAASAASLLLRTQNELGRLKVALKTLESRVVPGGVSGQAPALQSPLAAMLEEALAALRPAIRRGQQEVRLAIHSPEVPVAIRPEELFDLLAALCIISIEGAPPRALLDVSVESSGGEARVTVEHAGQARAVVSLEIHRELLRAATSHAGGSVDWRQSAAGSRAQMRLPTPDQPPA